MREPVPTTALLSWESGYNQHIDDGDDRYAVEQMLVGQADVVRYRPDDGPAGGVLDRWTYPSYEHAVVALQDFIMYPERDEPEGWHRHRPSNRRRPDGDPDREEVRA